MSHTLCPNIFTSRTGDAHLLSPLKKYIFLKVFQLKVTFFCCLLKLCNA